MQLSSQTPLLSAPRPVLWRPTAALAGLNGAITLSWIIYRIHLAGLLTQAGFPATFAPLLLLIESILAIGIEPWAGNLADRTPQRFGGRFYVILVGVGLTALLFVLLPGILGSVQPDPVKNWWVPGLLIVWAIAISMFRSPALALLSTYATPKQLPLAASLVTLAGALAGSMNPLAKDWLQGLGVVVTFVAAATLLLITTGWLKAEQPHVVSSPDLFEPLPLRVSALLRVFGLGLAVTLTFRLAIDLFPKILKAAGMQPPLFVGLIFISLAIGALVAGRWATRWGNLKVMAIGFGLTAAFFMAMTVTQQPITALLTALALGFSFSLILNGTLPIALNFVPLSHTGLSVGLFFAGAAAASSLQSSILSQPNFLSPTASISLGIVSLLMAGLCIVGQSTLPTSRPPIDN